MSAINWWYCMPWSMYVMNTYSDIKSYNCQWFKHLAIVGGLHPDLGDVTVVEALM